MIGFSSKRKFISFLQVYLETGARIYAAQEPVNPRVSPQNPRTVAQMARRES
jgi:hypothetical protein